MDPILKLRDKRQPTGVTIIVDPEEIHPVREGVSEDPTQKAIPTEYLETVATAISKLEPVHPQYSSSALYDPAYDTQPPEGTDIEAIRQIIAYLSRPLE
jgi:hypothetical protein